jgi:5-bromo-4-chloroindolyl phosphate hydrolysis protein
MPLLLAAIIALGAGNLVAVLAEGGAFSLYMLGATLTRRGIRSAHQGPALRYARRSPVSPRNLGAFLVTLATGITAYFAVGHGLFESIAFGAVALLAFHLLYGLEPLTPQRIALGGENEDERVVQALAEAEQRILSIEQAARAIGNPELRERLGRIGAQGRQILGQIERRPRDLRRARKFLTVYLEGAQQVTQGYADTHRLADSRALEQNFRTVLVTIEDVFAEQQKRLLDTDVMDLDVQIEVLTKQLKREGIL